MKNNMQKRAAWRVTALLTVTVLCFLFTFLGSCNEREDFTFFNAEYECDTCITSEEGPEMWAHLSVTEGEISLTLGDKFSYIFDREEAKLRLVAGNNSHECDSKLLLLFFNTLSGNSEQIGVEYTVENEKPLSIISYKNNGESVLFYIERESFLPQRVKIGTLCISFGELSFNQR